MSAISTRHAALYVHLFRLLRRHASRLPLHAVSHMPAQEANPSADAEGGAQLDGLLLSALANPRDRLTILKLDMELERFLRESRCAPRSLACICWRILLTSLSAKRGSSSRP